MYRRGADVIAFDMDAEELESVQNLFVAMREAGEVPEGAEADVKQGDALALPFGNGEFDRIVAAEVLEHIHADVDAIKELVRVLRPGGTLAISVPRWLPEVINWKLSAEYHNAEGGHIRIYTDHELIDKVTKAGRFNDGTPGDAMIFEGKGYAHGLHAPYWWIKCAVGVNNDDHPLAKAYHKLLVWEIMKQPTALKLAGKVLDPTIGKSMVLYFRKPEARVPELSEIPLARLPYVEGVLSAVDIAETAASIAAMQEPCGAIPWTVGEHADIWNHVEGAMAMLVGGQVRPRSGRTRGSRRSSAPTARSR